MDRLERIRQMEERLNRLLAWQTEMAHVLEGFTRAQEDVTALGDYLDSEEWQADFAADEAGELPEGLPRGVLSEDGIYNALETQRDLMDALWEA